MRRESLYLQYQVLGVSSQERGDSLSRQTSACSVHSMAQKGGLLEFEGLRHTLLSGQG